jgi:hypothetical protein
MLSNIMTIMVKAGRNYGVRPLQCILLLLILFLFSLALAPREGSTFTVHRPKTPPMTKKVTASPSSTSTTGVPNPTPTNPEHWGTTGPGPGTQNPTATATNVVPPRSPKPSPSPEPPKSKFPLFILFFSIFLVLGVVVWYLTRNVNFKRLFR